MKLKPLSLCKPKNQWTVAKVGDNIHPIREIKMRVYKTGISISSSCSIVFVLSVMIFGISAFDVSAQEDTGDQEAIAIFNQGEDAHEKGDLAGAIALYEKALKLVPEFPEAEYQLGVAELAIGKPDAAEAAFRRALIHRNDWTLAMTSLGSLLLAKNEIKDAETILTKVIEAEPQNPGALAALTDLRLKTDAPEGILKDLLAKIVILTGKANPTVSLWTSRGALEMKLGQVSLAKISLGRALAADPKNRSAMFQIADISVTEGDIDRARDLASRLAAAGERSDNLKLLWASIYAYEGKLDDAVKQLSEIKSSLTAADGLRSRVASARATTPLELEKRLESNGADPMILGRLCSMYRRDDPLKALDYCRRASAARTKNINHAVGFGAALVQAKQYEAAVNVFVKLLEIAPDNATAHANLATALFQLKRYAEAKPEYIWLTNAQPQSAAAYFFLGIVHDQLTEYVDALANYQQYLRLADAVENRTDIERVNLRLPALEKLVKERKGKKSTSLLIKSD